MGNVTRADIEAAVKAATGNPDVGPVAEVQTEIVNAIEELLNGPTPKEARVVKAPETRKTNNEE
jgi:hypothetical protein